MLLKLIVMIHARSMPVSKFVLQAVINLWCSQSGLGSIMDSKLALFHEASMNYSTSFFRVLDSTELVSGKILLLCST